MGEGKSLSFEVALRLDRSFSVSKTQSFRAGIVPTDPLVINLSGQGTSLASNKSIFNINIDGKDENMPFVTSGSGFLFLDKNGDGLVDDGVELFGPRTGNDFGELAQYDEDGNNWIDEKDGVFNKLDIWTKSGEGLDQYLNLKQAGVEAIYTGQIASPFELKDSSNNLNGVIRESGIFVRENGSAGTIQRVDLAV